MNKWIIILFTGILLIMFLYFENNTIVTTKVDIEFNSLPKGFEGFKILHLSDLHNKRFGKEQRNLIKIVEELKPDIIAITGDIVDRRRYNREPAIELAEGVSKIARTFYVIGNHEVWSGKVESIDKDLSESGVIVLRNESYKIAKNGDYINILGIDDPSSSYLENYRGEQVIGKEIDNAVKNTSGGFNILLSHRPEMISSYASKSMPLVLSGHAHGGQVRLPFIGGLVAPGQGLFPKYYEGIINMDNTRMIISRGLGNSIIPQRLFNRPEVILITLGRSSQ